MGSHTAEFPCPAGICLSVLPPTLAARVRIFTSRFNLTVLYLYISFCILQLPFHFWGAIPNASLGRLRPQSPARPSLPTEVLIYRQKHFPNKSSLFMGALMLERGFSALFWLRYCKACCHVPTKVSHSKFTDEITEGWVGVTPPHPCYLRSWILHLLLEWFDT